MKILFISAVLPYPLHSGGQVRIYNLLKRLSKRHEITLCSFIRDESERTSAKNVNFCTSLRTAYRGRALQARYLVRAFGLFPIAIERYPLLLETYNNEEMREIITQELDRGKYDLVHIEPFYVFPSLPDTHIPLVVGEHNVEYSVYEQIAKRYRYPFLRPVLARDARKIRMWEEKVWQKARAITAVSDVDKKDISRVTKTPVSVVPNGVDVAYFPYIKRSFAGGKETFLFVGDFAWMPNVEALGKLLQGIWPKIRKVYPHATLSVIGRHFPAAYRPFAGQGVALKNNVSDIRGEYASHDILLAPMGIGGGSKYKILEAMATGMAVIATQAGLVGIEYEDGIHAVCAETTEEFVAAVKTIYSSPAKTQKITHAARKLIEDAYNWDTIAGKLDLVWRGVV
jgi:glycosyltransferase involved in cell wall biosynthesis